MTLLKQTLFRLSKYLLHILLLDTLQINAVLSFTTKKKKDFLQVCEYLRQQSYVMPLLHLMTSNNPKMDWCNTLYFNYGHNVTFNFDYTLSRFNDYFATHKANGSRSNRFLPDLYQIWDEVIWLTPEKGRLVSTAPICWEQTEPYPKVGQLLNYNDWKQLGFLPQEICNVIIPVFSNPSSGPLCLARH